MAAPPVSKAAAARNTKPADPRHELIAGHRGAVREAVRELGYGGLTITGDDRDADLRQLEGQLAAATDGLERGALYYAMGANERLRENCIGATKYWREGRALLLEASRVPVAGDGLQRRNQAFRFYGRILVAEALCELTNGRALGMDDKILQGLRNLIGVPELERAEARFAMAIAAIETGSGTHASSIATLREASIRGDAKLRASIDRYIAAAGVQVR